MSESSGVLPVRPVLVRDRDGHARAFVKAVTWRITGSIDTFIWSLLVTHKPVSAGAIASLETVTKILLFYVHERLWRLIHVAPDSHLRSLAKALSWRVVGSLDTFILSLIVTGDAKLAISIASIDAISKIGLFYVHERIWRRVAWGRLEAA